MSHTFYVLWDCVVNPQRRHRTTMFRNQTIEKFLSSYSPLSCLCPSRKPWFEIVWVTHYTQREANQVFNYVCLGVVFPGISPCTLVYFLTNIELYDSISYFRIHFGEAVHELLPFYDTTLFQESASNYFGVSYLVETENFLEACWTFT